MQMRKTPLAFHPALAPYVRYCNVKRVSAKAGARVRNRTQADPWPSVVVTLGPAIRSVGGGTVPKAALFGPGELPGEVEFGPGHAHLTFSFYPGAAHAFFGYSLREFTDRAVPLAEVWGAELGERVAEAVSVRAMKDLVEAELLRRLGGAPAPLCAAVRAAVDSQGRAPVKELADAAGRGAEQLKRLFNQWVGLTPKVFSRIVRFQALCGALRADEAPEWAGLAYDFGYAHQSHLIRDFQDFAGESPARFYEDVVIPAAAPDSPLSAFQPDRTPFHRA